MKRTLFSLLVVAAAFMGMAPASPKSATYEVTADTIEGCSCPLFCTCYFSKSEPEHMCQFNNVYKFRKGSHYGDVDLSDQLVWLSGDLGGEWHKHPGPGMPTNWAVVTFDRRSSPEQKKAITKVVNSVFNVTWKKLDSREDTINWEDTPAKSHASMASGLADITLDKQANMKPDKNAPTVIKNLQYWGSNSNEGFVLAASTHNFNGDTKFSHEKKNGFTIAWTAKGNVTPGGA
jgi:hypothetical protein